jgi:hypothetical protein
MPPEERGVGKPGGYRNLIVCFSTEAGPPTEFELVY